MADPDEKNIAKSNRERVLIMGAAGRDFHTFNVCFRVRYDLAEIGHPDLAEIIVGFARLRIPLLSPPSHAGKERSGGPC